MQSRKRDMIKTKVTVKSELNWLKPYCQEIVQNFVLIKVNGHTKKATVIGGCKRNSKMSKLILESMA